jgi:hypothetical protein
VLPRRNWRLTGLVAAAVASSGLAACADPAPVETVNQALARLAPARLPRPLTPTDEPTSYRIEYDRYVAGHEGEGFSGSGNKERKVLKATHFVRRIIRPFDESGSTTRSLGFVAEGDGASRVTLVRPLPDDARPRLYQTDGTETAGDRVIAGRRCASVRVLLDDLNHEYCIDEAGLVLMTRTKDTLNIATKVTLLDRQPKAASELATELAKGFTEKGRGSIRPIHPDSAPAGTDWSLDDPPAGFELVGRFAVVPLTEEVLKRESAEGTEAKSVIAGIVDVYVRGIDAVIVDRGGKLNLNAVDEKDLGLLGEAHAVDLGALGTGQAGIGGLGAFGYREVRAEPSHGRYVVVAGTLPEAELVTIARSLRSRPGTTIRYLDS